MIYNIAFGPSTGNIHQEKPGRANRPLGAWYLYVYENFQLEESKKFGIYVKTYPWMPLYLFEFNKRGVYW